MAIYNYLEQAVKGLEAERDRESEIIKQRVTRDIIVPYNTDLDKARDKAIAELQTELNNHIVEIQASFAKKKQEIIDANEKQKETHANTVISSETYTVTVKYDKAIAKLHEQMKDYKE